MQSSMGATLAAVLALGILTRPAAAFEPLDIKRSDDRAANWVIEHYDKNLKSFVQDGKPVKDVMATAIIVTALNRHPHNYKEVAGPFGSEPVKYLLSQIKEDGSLTEPGADEWQAIAWVLTALKATENEKYAPLLPKLRARMEQLGAGKNPGDKWKTDDFNVTIDGDSLRKQIAHVQTLEKAKTKEVTIDGKKVMWSEILSMNLMKLQKPNGSFSDSLELNALTIELLNQCFDQYEDVD